METELILRLLAIALLSEVIGTVGGFGSSLFFVPAASLFLDFKSVLGLTALYHISSNLSKIYFFREGSSKKLFLTMGLPSIAMVIAGAWLSRFADPVVLQRILSAFLILTGLLFLLKKDLRISPSNPNAILGGSISGFLAGLVGTGGAVRGLFLTGFGLQKNSFIATSALIDLGVDASRSFVYLLNGFIQPAIALLALALFGVSFAGTFLGKKILNRFSEEKFRAIVLVMIIVMGFYSAIQSYS